MSAEAGAAQVAQGAQEAAQSPSAPAGGEPAQESAPGADYLSALGGGQPPQAPVTWTPQTEDDKFLYSPGANQPSYQAGGSLTAGPIAPPKDIMNWLPALRMAAADPGVNPAVKMLFNLVAHHVSGQ